MNRIDTAVIIPNLKSILKEYIRKYPQYKNFVLDRDFQLKEKYKELDADQIYLLGPTSMMKYGESHGDKRLYPSTCFILEGKLFFLSSSNDKFVVQGICKKNYLEHLDIDDKTPIDKSLFWLIKVSNNGTALILSTNIEKYTGIEKVKKSLDPSLVW